MEVGCIALWEYWVAACGEPWIVTASRGASRFLLLLFFCSKKTKQKERWGNPHVIEFVRIGVSGKKTASVRLSFPVRIRCFSPYFSILSIPLGGVVSVVKFGVKCRRIYLERTLNYDYCR